MNIVNILKLEIEFRNLSINLNDIDLTNEVSIDKSLKHIDASILFNFIIIARTFLDNIDFMYKNPMEEKIIYKLSELERK